MEEQISEIEEYASLLLTLDEISLKLNLDVNEFRREVRGKRTKRAKAYHRGKLNTLIAIRRITLELTLAGSPQAEALMIEFLDKQNSNE